MAERPTAGSITRRDWPKLTEMIKALRRTFDVAKRREMLYDIQRCLSQQTTCTAPR